MASDAPDALLDELARTDDLEGIWLRWSDGGTAALVARVVTASDAVHHLVARDVGAAMPAARRLVATADRSGASGACAAARLALAVACSYSNAFGDALATLDEAAGHADGDPVLAARVQMARMHALARLGRLDEAAAAGESALAALRSHGQVDFAVKAEANLGVIERMRQRPDRAIVRFRAALDGWGPDPISRAQLSSNLAEALLETDRFVEAEAWFRGALTALETAGSEQAARIVEGNLADLLARQGRLNEALEHYEHVRRRFIASDAGGDAARLQAEEADAFAQIGLLHEAVAEYRSSLPDLERFGLVVEAMRARLGLVRTLARLGRLDDAQQVLSEGPSSDAIPAAFLGRVRRCEAEIARLRGDASAAERLFLESIDAPAVQPLEQAIAVAGLATLLIAEGRASDALPHVDAALAVAARHLCRPLEADLLNLKARCLREQGDGDGAVALWRAALERIETLRGTLQAERHRVAFTANNVGAVGAFLIELLRRGDQASLLEAMAVSERMRGRSLLDLVAGTTDFAVIAKAERDDATAAALVREAAEIRHQANALFSRIDRTPDASISDAWRSSVLALEERARVVDSRLGATHRLSGLLASPPDAATIAGLGRPGVAIVSYVVAEGRLLGIGLVDGRACGADLGDVASIAEEVERWRFQIHRNLVSMPGANGASSRAARLEADLARASEALAESVLRPLWSHIRHARAIEFVPAGPLHAVAFATLAMDGEPLIVSRAIASVPSVGILATLRRLVARDRLLSLVIGVADEAAPAIATEARAIAERDPHSRLIMGSEATVERVSAAAQDADVIHLAAHGRFLPESPLHSGIRLFDRWFTVRDALAVRLPGSVVILSGCDTGRVSVDGGDEITGLLRGFFAAGARAIVLSAWPVHDQATVEIMTLFHEFLGTNCGAFNTNASLSGHLRRFDPAEALRAAMLEVRSRRPRMVEWGAFSVIGDVGEAELPQQTGSHS